MKILILGGTGAMGNDLVDLLSNTEHEIIVTSRSEQKSNISNVNFVKGNALDDEWLSTLLESAHYDVIVDFMSYSTERFSRRVDLLLSSTDQYLFFSSSRVYADSEDPITEESDRLLDVCKDTLYLATDEYALAKARQEDLLRKSGKQNWTIIRPYITYSDIRLQLGFQEKELWLYRALHGHTIVFAKDIADLCTTLTYGRDVAQALIKVIGNSNTYGQVFHVTRSESVKWEDILETYIDVLGTKLGKPQKILLLDSSGKLAKVCRRDMQRKYDRLYNRRFDNSKIASVSPEMLSAVSPQVGLRKCLEDFLEHPVFRDLDWRAEGYMDKVTHENTSLSEIPGTKNKIRYLLARYTPYFELR